MSVFVHSKKYAVGKYSIKDIEQLSGIKAHTLRIWEQRYQILEPKRTPTNIRYYDDSDLRLVLNISFLNKNNYKISKIAKMSDEEIQEKVRQIADSNLEFPTQMNALIIAMVELDEERFEKIISTNTLQFGFENTMMNIVWPFLYRIGILWQTGNINPAHEHFMSNLIRQKLIVAIDGQMPPRNPYAKKYLLFLPEGELHELSLLFAAYVIKARYNKLIYLGQSLPLDDVGAVVETYRPDFVITVGMNFSSDKDALAFVSELKGHCPDQKILLSGTHMLHLKMEEKLDEEFMVFKDITELVEFVNENSDQPFMRKMA